MSSKSSAFEAENRGRKWDGEHFGDDFRREFIKKHDMNWAQIYGGRLLRAFLNPKKSIPYVILLDDQMKVRWMGNPSLHWGEIEKIIQNN